MSYRSWGDLREVRVTLNCFGEFVWIHFFLFLPTVGSIPLLPHKQSL
jgi:hypothetical protein